MDNRYQGTCRMSHQKGFTLLDLLTTLAIAAILVSFAVPGLQSITASSRQSGSVNELVSAMHIARSTAVTQNARVTACASEDGESCAGDSWHKGFIVFRDDDNDQAVDGGETIIYRGGELEYITIKPKLIGDALSYRTNGRTTLPANGTIVGSFSFCDSRGVEYARGFAIDMSGQPRVLDKGDASLAC